MGWRLDTQATLVAASQAYASVDRAYRPPVVIAGLARGGPAVCQLAWAARSLELEHARKLRSRGRVPSTDAACPPSSMIENSDDDLVMFGAVGRHRFRWLTTMVTSSTAVPTPVHHARLRLRPVIIARRPRPRWGYQVPALLEAGYRAVLVDSRRPWSQHPRFTALLLRVARRRRTGRHGCGACATTEPRGLERWGMPRARAREALPIARRRSVLSCLQHGSECVGTYTESTRRPLFPPRG